MAQLRELGEWLVDIHGQHAWQSLTRPAAVRALLDAYAGADARALAAAWQDWQRAQAALAEARAAQNSLAQERERLLWQIGEIDKLAPLAGEWDELNQRHARLSHAQALIDAAQAAGAALEGDEGDAGALPALARAQDALAAQQAIEPEFAALLEVLQACEAQARDAAHSLHTYLRRAEPDPDQLAALDERMVNIHSGMPRGNLRLCGTPHSHGQAGQNACSSQYAAKRNLSVPWTLSEEPDELANLLKHFQCSLFASRIALFAS